MAVPHEIFGTKAKKPYVCTEHYSYKYCVKIGQTVAINQTASATSEPIIQNQTSPKILPKSDIIKNDVKSLDSELVKLKTRLTELNISIPQLEKSYDHLQNVQKRAKANHDNNPSDSTRIELEKASNDFDVVRKDLSLAKQEKRDIDGKISILNRKIIETNTNLKASIKEEKSTFNPFGSVGVNLSKTCITSIKNNLTTTCPDYRILQELGFDTSHKYSGKLEFSDGYWHRKQLVKNDYMLYDLKNGYNILVDPSSSLSQRVKMITISNNFNQYLLSEDMVKINNTRIIHKDRYVDKCNEAIINSDTWLETLADTINYLRSGCKGTLLNTVDTIHDNHTKQQIDTSNKWKHDKWLAEAKKKYKISYIGSQENGTNRSVTTMGDEK